MGGVARRVAGPLSPRCAEIQRLIDDGAVEDFADGAEVILAGAPTSTVYFLVDGACDVHRADGTVRLAAPAMVGEIAALTGTLRTATVRAAGGVRTVVVSRERFLEAIRTSPAAGQALTELVADRICAPDSIRQVGRFAIEGIVGSGGSGRVFRARHPLLEIPIALKMLSHALALMPGGPRAFVREASLLAQLDHPGIVRVLDAFEDLGTFFIVMPWIEGATLRELIDRRRDVHGRRGDPRSRAKRSTRWPPSTPRAWCTATSNRRTSSCGRRAVSC